VCFFFLFGFWKGGERARLLFPGLPLTVSVLVARLLGEAIVLLMICGVDGTKAAGAGPAPLIGSGEMSSDGSTCSTDLGLLRAARFALFAMITWEGLCISGASPSSTGGSAPKQSTHSRKGQSRHEMWAAERSKDRVQVEQKTGEAGFEEAQLSSSRPSAQEPSPKATAEVVVVVVVVVVRGCGSMELIVGINLGVGKGPTGDGAAIRTAGGRGVDGELRDDEVLIDLVLFLTQKLSLSTLTYSHQMVLFAGPEVEQGMNAGNRDRS
jgi:hypothetical protein